MHYGTTYIMPLMDKVTRIVSLCACVHGSQLCGSHSAIICVNYLSVLLVYIAHHGT